MSIEHVRKEAMFKLGLDKSTEELVDAANKAQRKITDRIGRSSVKNFERIYPKIKEIDQIKESTHKEDTEWHTDKWVILKTPIAGRRFLPLEIKSSDYGVREVKNSKDYKRNPICLVVNANKRRRDDEIIEDFLSELQVVAGYLTRPREKRILR